MQRSIRWYDYITINANWFALTARSQVLTPLIIPLLVQEFIGEASKGTYVGIIRLWALMIAVLVQAFMGSVSDRSNFRWGRRRPFILAGTLGELLIFSLIAWLAASSLGGMPAFWVLFGLYILSMLTSNTSHAATQGLIPDLVPEEKRGLFSGVKALMELPLPLIFVSFVIAAMVARGDIKGAFIALSISMLVGMGITMLAPEKPLGLKPPPLDWKPIIRLLGMTAAFTLIILGSGAAVGLLSPLAEALPGLGGSLLIVLLGLAAMTLAAWIGVWLSIRISLGSDGPEPSTQNRSFTWWVINRLTFLVASTNLATFLVFFIQEKFPELTGERAAGPAANVVMFVGVFILVTAVPSGWLADRFGKKTLCALSGLLAAIGTAIVLLAADFSLIYIGGSVIGAGVGLFYSANWALGTEIVPKARAGEYLGIQNLAGAGAGAIGAYIGGPIADANSYVLLLSIYALMFLLSTLALMRVREPEVRT